MRVARKKLSVHIRPQNPNFLRFIMKYLLRNNDADNDFWKWLPCIPSLLVTIYLKTFGTDKINANKSFDIENWVISTDTLSHTLLRVIFASCSKLQFFAFFASKFSRHTPIFRVFASQSIHCIFHSFHFTTILIPSFIPRHYHSSSTISKPLEIHEI